MKQSYELKFYSLVGDDLKLDETVMRFDPADYETIIHEEKQRIAFKYGIKPNYVMLGEINKITYSPTRGNKC